MKSFLTPVMRLFVKRHVSKILNLDLPLKKQRHLADQLGRVSWLASGLKCDLKVGTVSDVSVEWVKHCDCVHDDKVILYFHGGGFILGSMDSHRLIAGNISKVTGVPVLLVDYRLAPEHSYPAAEQDCLTVYQWLLRFGFTSEDIILGGDSAGGYLTMQTLLSLKQKKAETTFCL